MVVLVVPSSPSAHYARFEWIAAYLVDTDNNVFMQDVRWGSLLEERLLFSQPTTPEVASWIQFGTRAVFIFLSRLASAAEQGFLKYSLTLSTC
jgi:hypothetical protein